MKKEIENVGFFKILSMGFRFIVFRGSLVGLYNFRFYVGLIKWEFIY